MVYRKGSAGSVIITTSAAFTIVELLVVIVVIGILASVTIVAYNGISGKAKDTTKVSNVKALDKAIGIAYTLGQSLGSPNTIYLSLPDNNANCSSYTNLPTIATGWSYSCVSSANLTKVDGTGWVPINLSGRLSSLPIDDTNNGNSYLSYVTNGEQYQFTVPMSQPDNQYGGSNDLTSTDGGIDPTKYEIGTNLNLNPLAGIVINGGFEIVPNDNLPQTSATGRWLDGTVAGNASIQQYSIFAGLGGTHLGYVIFDDTNSHSGDYSLKIHMEPGSFSEARLKATGYHHAYGIYDIKLQPNTNYRYSVWLKSENVSGSSSSGQSVRFMFSDASGGGASVVYNGDGGSGTSSEFSAGPSILFNRDWTQYDGAFTTGSSVNSFHPEYRVYAHTGAATLSGDFWFDDLVIWKQ
jgi:prepilin-type N-terminal cleavage/methylation domain-containing protein